MKLSILVPIMSMLDGISKVLVLGPHPDDGEFGAGATIHKLTQQGAEVHYAVFSPCKKSLPDGLPEDTLYRELVVAAAALGIPESNLHTYDFSVRDFPAHRQDILETLITLRKAVNPELILLPNAHDIHQDHHVMYEEGVRAFKHRILLGYELPWNNHTMVTNFHVAVSESNLSAKGQALEAYQSQSFRNYASKSFIESLATVRGVQAGVTYAEAFQLIHGRG